MGAVGGTNARNINGTYYVWTNKQRDRTLSVLVRVSGCELQTYISTAHKLFSVILEILVIRPMTDITEFFAINQIFFFVIIFF